MVSEERGGGSGKHRGERNHEDVGNKRVDRKFLRIFSDRAETFFPRREKNPGKSILPHHSCARKTNGPSEPLLASREGGRGRVPQSSLSPASSPHLLLAVSVSAFFVLLTPAPSTRPIPLLCNFACHPPSPHQLLSCPRSLPRLPQPLTPPPNQALSCVIPPHPVLTCFWPSPSPPSSTPAPSPPPPAASSAPAAPPPLLPLLPLLLAERGTPRAAASRRRGASGPKDSFHSWGGG